jgi:hypothetical protein
MFPARCYSLCVLRDWETNSTTFLTGPERGLLNYKWEQIESAFHIHLRALQFNVADALLY